MFFATLFLYHNANEEARVLYIPSCSQMPVVSYHSVIHGLGFYICYLKWTKPWFQNLFFFVVVAKNLINNPDEYISHLSSPGKSNFLQNGHIWSVV